MRGYLSLLLFIGLAWGQSLKFVNTDGQSVIINPSQGGLTSGFLYLNGTKYFLKDVDYKTKMVKVKKVYRTGISQLINYNKYEEIPFDAIHSFKYIKRRFSAIPILIGGGIGYYFLANPKADTLSFYLGTIPAFTLGLSLSIVPRYSEELLLSDDGWSISD